VIRSFLLSFLVVFCGPAGAAEPASLAPLQVATTSGAESSPLFLATQEGMFSRRGLSVTPVILPLMPNLPAAVLSGSVQIGSMVATTFLQAAGNGLDLVAVSGGSVTSQSASNIALIAGSKSGIHSAQDLVGRKVGMPGLGAFMHVSLRYWLTQKGVDWRRVNFIETTFPSMRDLLKAGTVDAVGAIDPFARSIVDSGAGTVVSYFLQEIPGGKPSVLYAATRDWATAHPAELAAFRAGIQEAIGVIREQPDRARQALGAYVKLPPAVLATTDLGVYDPELTAEGMAWWIDVMKAQEMVGDQMDVAGLIYR
jgi:NitT/TauT family transport system substrate-binding protein